MHFVNMKPLDHEATRLEAGRGDTIKFLTEHAAHPCEPWIGGLANDHIITLGIELQYSAGIFHSNPGEGIRDHSPVPWRKEFCGADDGRAILRHRQMLDRMGEESAGRNSAPQTKGED